MPGENTKVAELEGQVANLEAMVEKLTKQLEAAGNDDPDLKKTVELQGQLDEALSKLDEMTDALEKVMADSEAAKAELAIAKAMSDEEKDYCKDMKAEERSAFMAKPADERKKAMQKKADADETVVVEGETIRKSAVGDAVFSVMKKQAERIAKSEKDIAEERERREMSELRKRADDQYSHVPGTTEERAKVLAAIAKMDEPVQKSLTAILESCEKLTKAGFDKIGHGGGKGADLISDEIKKQANGFEAKVVEIKSRDKCSGSEAMTKARREFPDLYKAYSTVNEAAN